MEHMLRSSLIAVRLADRCGLDEAERGAVYYGTLIAWIGCHADSPEIAAAFGDDIEFRADTYRVDRAGLPFLRLMLSHTGAGLPTWERTARRVAFACTARARMSELISSHCASAGTLAVRVGLGPDVAAVVAAIFERWDGGGMPTGARGPELPTAACVVQVAEAAEVHLRAGGVTQAVAVVRERAGGAFSPSVAEVFAEHADEIVDGLVSDDVWAAALAQAPDGVRVLSATEVDAQLRELGTFVDLKCPTMVGHATAVAELAAAAAGRMGMAPNEIRDLRRAGLVHGLGRIGVSNSIWDKPGPLTAAEFERLRLYPYLTGRILGRVSGLEPIVAIASAHRERLDGSGFPRGVGGADLSAPARVLAAAEAYRSWLEPRPYRPALATDRAADRLRAEARAGRLDPEAVDAVLAVAGHRGDRARPWPAGLTDREVEVLRLLAYGRSNREIADDLSIAAKTARNHVEHIYLKLGVGNRTQASLAAIDQGLVRPPVTLRG
ncbi:HD domain-containing phosphohydrolase [Rhodococcus kronopolitis]|uniref:HD domain-containing phosphohydrolase n=1 Tax=Rhodococcus kronopolitis TaxID=1460226 RepID=A0ABV9FNZ2_9NOCA